MCRHVIYWVFALALVAGCSSPDQNDNSDAGLDAGTQNPCSEALPATGAFSRHVRAKLPLVTEYETPSRTLEDTVELDVYLPQGLAPNAPVLVASPLYKGFHAVSGKLDGSSSAKVPWAGTAPDRYHRSIDVHVSPEGVFADVEQNMAEYTSDVVSPAGGSGWLCPVGPTPDPALALVLPKVGPLSMVRFTSTVPLDPTTIHVTASSASGPLSVTADLSTETTVFFTREVLRVYADEALPLNEDLDIDASALRDVLGRPVAGHIVVPALKATTPLVDLTFAQEPPSGAVDATINWSVRGGLLLVPGSEPTNDSGAQEVLIRLPALTGKARVRLAFARPEPMDDSASAGSTTYLLCSNGSGAQGVYDSATDSVSIDGPASIGGDCYLILRIEFPQNWPQWLPMRAQRWLLDEITLE